MSHFVYILHSDKIDKYYIGYSSNVSKRLEYHNSEYNKIWSQRGKPWRLLTKIEFTTKSDALKAEQRIKSFKSKKVVESIIQFGWKDFSES